MGMPTSKQFCHVIMNKIPFKSVLMLSSSYVTVLVHPCNGSMSTLGYSSSDVQIMHLNEVCTNCTLKNTHHPLHNQ